MPEIHPDAYIHPDAVVIGRVSVGAEATVWPGAVLRGDDGAIHIGARTSVQDGTVVHTTAEFDTIIGADCVIGHVAHLEGCVVEDRALVGSGSIVLHQAVVGSGAIVGANAVVPGGTHVPARAMALGVPARIRRGRGAARVRRRRRGLLRRAGPQVPRRVATARLTRQAGVDA